MDAEAVRRYLTGEDEASALWSSEESDGGKGRLEVLWYPDLDHAHIFEERGPRKALRGMVQRFIMKEEEES